MTHEDGATATPRPTAQVVAERLHQAVGCVMRGKQPQVELAVATLLAGGHLLLDDLPGTGKTLLAKSLAVAAGGRFGRVQCTPDLLPSDLTGTSVFQPGSGEWKFRPGPVFANVVLVDEVNRASPRTQSALLEPMEEGQVTVDGETWLLPVPFFCIATQNPQGQIGTFPLPESQLDRFTVSMSIGLPDRSAEREILSGNGGVAALARLRAVTTPEELASAIASTAEVWFDDRLTEYVLDLAAATRADDTFSLGASSRAAISLVAVARGLAVVGGRDYVLPDDVQAVVPAAWAHRVQVAGTTQTAVARQRLGELVRSVAVPHP